MQKLNKLCQPDKAEACREQLRIVRQALAELPADTSYPCDERDTLAQSAAELEQNLEYLAKRVSLAPISLKRAQMAANTSFTTGAADSEAVAIAAYERERGLPVGTATIEQVAATSAGIAGYARSRIGRVVRAMVTAGELVLPPVRASGGHGRRAGPPPRASGGPTRALTFA